MIAIQMRFLTGRFHATPWGHHVNEGVVEYPPSLWRLLRSLVATFYRVFPDRAHQDKEDNPALAQLKRIVAALSSPPEFYLPPAAVAHTRHYDQDHDGVKFFDTFVSLNPQESIIWVWRDVYLADEDRAALSELLISLGAFGRAESWCEANLLSTQDAEALLAKLTAGQGINSQPVALGTNLGSSETMRLLLPDASADPDKLFETLITETAKMRKAKQLEPTGTQWVTYTRPSDIFKQVKSKTVTPETPHYTVARFALSAKVLPLVTDSMPFGEMTRFALSHCRAGNSYSPALSGKSKDGIPLAGHQHAHFLATDEDGDGRLDHITIYASCGFNSEDLEALGQLPSVRRYKNLPNVRTTLIGLGTTADFSNVSIFKASKLWRSVTPFSLPRFPNRGGGKPPRPRDLPEAQLIRELKNRGLPEPVSFTRITELHTKGRSFRWLEFHSRRLRKDLEGSGLYGFEIEFAEEVAGPLALGFGCHFGLGLFLPDWSSD